MSGQPSDRALKAQRLLGPWMSAALVVGNMIGAGIFLLPAAIAPLGANAIFAWALTVGGTLCVASAFAMLARRGSGGLHGQLAAAFGTLPASLTLWSYLAANWSAAAALAVAAAGAAARAAGPRFPASLTPLAAIAAIASVLLLNLADVRVVGRFQFGSTLVKILPLLLVLALAAAAFAGGRLMPLGEFSLSVGGVAAGVALMAFSMGGFEAASLASERTRKPSTTVPLATMFGTSLTGVLYFASCTSVILLLGMSATAASPQPFADAAQRAVGSATGRALAAVIAVSALGALNSTMLVNGEVASALAAAGDLPAPLARRRRSGSPTTALFASAAIAALLVYANSTRTLVSLYALVALMSVVSTSVLWSVAAAAALRLERAFWRRAVAALGLLYALWTFYGAGREPFWWGTCLTLAGVPVILFARRSRGARAQEARL